MVTGVGIIHRLRQELKARVERTTTARLEGLASRKKLVQWLMCGSTWLGFSANLVLQ